MSIEASGEAGAAGGEAGVDDTEAQLLTDKLTSSRRDGEGSGTHRRTGQEAATRRPLVDDPAETLDHQTAHRAAAFGGLRAAIASGSAVNAVSASPASTPTRITKPMPP